MFYPSDFLKRGGRFYLCWVADSWPWRFATITHKQLWSHDIRNLCQDLHEVMVVESGQATARFSLRLSSQLLRGIVRLYQRKVTVFLGDLCMLNAHVNKLINKKYSDDPPPPQRIPKQPRVRILEIPDDEEQVEERIKNSGNAVVNTDQITLKEAVITDIVLPNDNFGEENPEQAFQLLNDDRTLEVMLGMTDVSGAHQSGLELQPLETSDKSTDKSRLHANERVMERISEHDLTLRKSSALGDISMPAEEMDKDIPEILPTHLPVPSPIKIPVEPIVEEPPINVVVGDPAKKSDESGQLKELEDNYVEPVRHRRPKRLIVDKKIQISSNVIRKRLQIVALELRCEDSSDDVVDPYRLSHANYFRRPAHAGWRLQTQLAAPLHFMFQRNLGHRLPSFTEKDQEFVPADDMRQRQNRTTLGNIVEKRDIEVPGTVPVPEAIRPNLEMLFDAPVVPEDLVAGEHRVSNVEPVDIDVTEMPTQVLATTPNKKRQATQHGVSSPAAKRLKACGFVSYKLSQRCSQEEILKGRETDQNIIQPQKELVPADVSKNLQDDKDPNDQCQLTHMLDQAGLADAEHIPVVPSIIVSSVRRSRKDASDDSSETQLGSLDRTQVDLGESEKTTDSKKCLRKEWGTQGTMFKIIRLVQRGVSPLTVRDLVENGPINGSKAVIAALCFNSLLKLKQHNFIDLEQDMESLKITNILIGPRVPKIQIHC